MQGSFVAYVVWFIVLNGVFCIFFLELDSAMALVKVLTEPV